MNWYKGSASAVIKNFKTSLEGGLKSEQAAKLLESYGPNTTASKRKESLFQIFLRQFKSPLIFILLIAAFLVVFIGQKTDAFVILLLVLINSIVGTIQEGRARNSLEKLKALIKSKILVRRDGKEVLISSEEVVPGDILVLHEGVKIAADARLVTVENLQIDESILTGESRPVVKITEAISGQDLIVGDQKNMAFAGTTIISGYGQAIVVATGFETELGKISKGLLTTSKVLLPLEKKVERLSRQIGLGVLGIAASVLIVGVVRGISLLEMTGAVVGLAVSVIPEGLPVVVTIVLAKGVWRMAHSQAIVRRMVAVEAMGAADTLLVDKTGTITTGQMMVSKVYFDGREIEVDGDGYDPLKPFELKGDFGQKLKKILTLTYLSIKADVVKDKDGWKPTGDTTEAAIAVFCRKAGLSKEQLEKQFVAKWLMPFDAKKRYSKASFKENGDEWTVFVGAPDFLEVELDLPKKFSNDYQSIVDGGLRVMGLVVFGPKKRLDGYAFVAIEEEVRPNVAQAVALAQKVGFKVAILTGDFPTTAKTIAQKVGIYKDGDQVLTGSQIEGMAKGELAGKIDSVSVFARITPNHKLEIVNAFKAKGHVVAVTGDGVNDGPALQAADLGIGIGSGTDVAKESSDIILADNDFSTIVSAIYEGRGIYLTLKKVILYLFSTSFGEVLVIFCAIALGLPLPLVAVQIIWLNFVTDGFLDVSLAQDPPKNYFGSSRFESKNLVDRLMIVRMVITGLAMLLITLPTFYYFLHTYDISYARSMALLVLSVTQWFNALNVRSRTRSIFTMSLTNNWVLIGAFVVVVGLQIFAFQTRLGNSFLHVQPLPLNHWLLAIGLSTVVIFFEETRKLTVKILLGRSKRTGEIAR